MLLSLSFVMGIAVLFTSGHAGLDTVRRGLMKEGSEFMQKPLEPDAVAKKVRQILDVRRALGTR